MRTEGRAPRGKVSDLMLGVWRRRGTGRPNRVGAYARPLQGRTEAGASSAPSAQMALSALRASQLGLVLTDASQRIVLVNEAFSRITGYRSEEVRGRNPSLLSSGVHEQEFYHRMWGELRRRGTWRGEIWNRRKSGEIYPEWLLIDELRDRRGRVSGYCGMFEDITARKSHETRLTHRAYSDPLTGLPNRALLEDRIDQALALARRSDWCLAVLVVDLDGFKAVNDRYGHRTGDEVLCGVGRIFVSALRASDTVARIGGDEFVILLRPVEEPRDCASVASKVLCCLQPGVPVEGRTIRVGASIGISLYPQDGVTAQQLIERADQAMYHVKRHGKGGHRFCSGDMNVEP